MFDDGAADALIAAAEGASGGLRSQAMADRVRVEAAVREFRGSYATLFTTDSTIRSEDTQRLAGVFADLKTSIGRNARPNPSGADSGNRANGVRVRRSVSSGARPGIRSPWRRPTSTA